jgi:aminoacrylate hydrolase
LHFQVQGTGQPLVLMAGLGGLGVFWQPVVERLAHGFMCITFDHPGIGRSPPCTVHTIENIAAELVRLLDQLDLPSAHFVGHSTGGLVAQVLGLDHPQRVNRAVLSATWARPDLRFRDLFETRRTVLERAGFGAYNAMARLLGYPADWYESRLASDAPIDFDAGAAGDIVTAVARINMLLNFDRAEELNRIKVPVLIVGASDDAIVPFYHSQDLACRIKQARLLELRGGHFLPQTETESYVAALKDFLLEGA